MYDHKNQYRCTIIRGKSQKEMDDLLPAYAKVLDEICPCDVDDFEQRFNNAFSRYLPESARIKKTLDNHRTEISGKLFGMYYASEDGKVYISERTQKYLEDNDQPAFFKDICYKMQFPNGMQKSNTVQERIDNDICVRPNAFLLKFLRVAKDAGLDISKDDIGYYILNSKDVLQGKANPYEILEVIANDKKNGVQRKIIVPGKASSYTMQHINEQINYLELANLVRVTDDKRVFLNPKESDVIDIFIEGWDKKPEFDVASYDMTTVESKKEFQYAWDAYYARLSAYASRFCTSVDALSYDIDPKEEQDKQEAKKDNRMNLTEFGDEGEAIVLAYEKDRVTAFNRHLANKVIAMGKQRGIGYDIQSVIAEPGDRAEFVKLIEVKSTKRLTCPDVSDNLWVDTLNVTRNEWVAAQQYKDMYYIYRVYFTKSGITMFILSNVADKLNDGRMQATPMTYRIDFGNDSVDNVIELQLAGGQNV